MTEASSVFCDTTARSVSAGVAVFEGVGGCVERRGWVDAKLGGEGESSNGRKVWWKVSVCNYFDWVP